MHIWESFAIFPLEHDMSSALWLWIWGFVQIADLYILRTWLGGKNWNAGPDLGLGWETPELLLPMFGTKIILKTVHCSFKTLRLFGKYKIIIFLSHGTWLYICLDLYDHASPSPQLENRETDPINIRNKRKSIVKYWHEITNCYYLRPIKPN